MISHFPILYPDELLYSLFARYYNRSGYLAYIYAAQDLYTTKTTRPDIEFINELNPDIKNILIQNKSFEDIIYQHTMFPYYGRFLNKERRNNAFQSLVNMDKKYNNFLFIPKNNKERFLRYCPLCVTEDKKQYGETYWHRVHQISDLNICPIHYCKLINSKIIISSKLSPCLISAEEEIKETNNIYISENELERKVAKYILTVFQSEINMNLNIETGKFIQSKMAYTKYLSLRGQKRNMSLLYSDFQNYYKTLPNIYIKEQWQFQKIFTSHRCNTFEICLLAMFLGISANELKNMKLPKKTQQELFDEKIISLRNQGLKYPEIAKELNASYDVVKAIGEDKYGYYHYHLKPPQKGGAKKKDWNTFDETMLPLIKDIINKLNNVENLRPQRITITTIERLLHIPKKSLLHCPLCISEIKKHYITQEEYWAQEVVWATKKIIQENQPFNLTRILRLINLRKQDFNRCISYLNIFGDEILVNKIKSLI